MKITAAPGNKETKCDKRTRTKVKGKTNKSDAKKRKKQRQHGGSERRRKRGKEEEETRRRERRHWRDNCNEATEAAGRAASRGRGIGRGIVRKKEKRSKSEETKRRKVEFVRAVLYLFELPFQMKI
jgi:hypothetical protein